MEPNDDRTLPQLQTVIGCRPRGGPTQRDKVIAAQDRAGEEDQSAPGWDQGA